LEELRTKVKTALDQTGKDNEQKDGMDIAFCIYDTFSQQLHYAGAYNPLVILPENTTQIVEYEATRNPIGIYIKEKPFTNHTIQTQKGDTIYLFSDGIIDQMGGEKNEKFKMRRLMALLSSFGNQSLANQHAILSQTMDNWMIKPDGESRFKQIDDMLLIGIKL